MHQPHKGMALSIDPRLSCTCP